VGPHQFHPHVYGRVNVPADAASCAIVPLLHSVTSQLGIVAVQIPFPERALAFLNRALDAIQAAQMDEHPVPTPTSQVVDVAPQDLSDDDVELPHILPAIPQVVASHALLGDDEILCDADYDSEARTLLKKTSMVKTSMVIFGMYPVNTGVSLGTDMLKMRFDMLILLMMKNWLVMMKYGNNLSFITILLQQFLFLGHSRKTNLIGCTTLVQHTLVQKINRCSVPFRLRKWEKKKRVSQVHLSLWVGVSRRLSGVLLGVQNWQINVLPTSDLAPRLYGNQCLCFKLVLKQS
jgi:hypothetical protein